MEAFQRANYMETLAGRIVLTVGCMTTGDVAKLESWGLSAYSKLQLDELHKRKIDLADEIYVLNVGDYIGESTQAEIDYAHSLGKPIRWLEGKKTEADPWAVDNSATPSAAFIKFGEQIKKVVAENQAVIREANFTTTIKP
jgi:hypothetical protein